MEHEKSASLQFVKKWFEEKPPKREHNLGSNLALVLEYKNVQQDLFDALCQLESQAKRIQCLEQQLYRQREYEVLNATCEARLERLEEVGRKFSKDLQKESTYNLDCMYDLVCVLKSSGFFLSKREVQQMVDESLDRREGEKVEEQEQEEPNDGPFDFSVLHL